MDSTGLLKRARILLGLFAAGLIVSGLTAIPLILEVSLLDRFFGQSTFLEAFWPGIARWISLIHQGLVETGGKYPFIRYGTDWLAFAHIVIAIAFWGPIKDPVKNLWVIEFGMIACILIIPTVLIFAPLRGIPPFWQLIDCSFGIFGFIPLWFAHRYARRLAAAGEWNRSLRLSNL